MAKFTVLQMTQEVLSALSSDSVNSISDTVESLQVANIIQNKYYDIQTRASLPDDLRPFQLNASGDSTKPTLMTVPSGVNRIKWIKYFDANPADGASLQTSQFGAYSHDLNLDIPNSATSWITSSSSSVAMALGSKSFTVPSGIAGPVVGQSVIAQSGTNSLLGTLTSYVGTTMVINVTSMIGSGTYNAWVISSNVAGVFPPGYLYVTILPIEQFFEMINRFNPGDSNVRSFTFTNNAQNYTFYYKNNIQPHYCTILSNQYVFFDSFDSGFDTTLQGSKTMCYGQIVPAFSLTDNFIPVMDDNQFPLLINEAKALAFYELKQMPHAKAEQEIKRQWSTVQKNKSLVNRPTYFDELADFGRQPNTGGYSGVGRPRLRSWGQGGYGS